MWVLGRNKWKFAFKDKLIQILFQLERTLTESRVVSKCKNKDLRTEKEELFVFDRNLLLLAQSSK